MSNNLQVANRADLISFSNDEKHIIRKQFFPPNASDSDMIYCMKVAQTFGLNPILKQIYFVERKAQVNNQWIIKTEPLVGRDSFLTLAHRSGKFAGIESETMLKDKPFFDGKEWQIRKELVAIAKAYRSDCDKPFVVEVSYCEYAQKKLNGEITKFWKTMPETMLKKVAESQVLRKAFDISGLYSIDEINTENDNLSYNENNAKNKTIDLNSVATGTTEAEIINDEVVYEPYYDEMPTQAPQTPQPEPKPQQTYKAEPKEQAKSQPTQPNHETKEILKQLLMQKGLHEHEAIDFMAKNAYTPVLAKQFLDDDKKLEIKLAEFFGSEINL